jgi:ABC-2 type transport system permease protein
MIRINAATPPAWQLLLSVVIMLASILAIAAVAARIFRVGILMYGKRPTLPELLRWIRAK